MENETIERMLSGLKESIEELKRGNINIYSKIDNVMEKVSQHSTSIELLNQKTKLHDDSIKQLMDSQKELFDSQGTLIDKIGKNNRSNLSIAITASALILTLIGYAIYATTVIMSKVS